MTVVINLIGAAGTGESTLALGLVSLLKKNHQHAEYVPEYVKQMAWEGRKTTHYDGPSIFGAQWKSESVLYGKLDYVVTDAPVFMPAFYETLHCGTHHLLPAVQSWMHQAEKDGVTYLNFLLGPVSSVYDQRGRYQDKETSDREGELLRAWLAAIGVTFTALPGTDPDSRAQLILDALGLNFNAEKEACNVPLRESPIELATQSLPGYHLQPIPKGEFGEISKIREELDELEDAKVQGVKLMELIELSDLIGAVDGYLKKHHPGTSMDDLTQMAGVTKRAFENGHRK